MSVIKNLRSLSKMEFYHTALVLRDMLTKWLMKEFGIKPSYKEYELRASDISPEDLAAIDSIYEKYGINRKKAYASVYPQWLSEDEKLYFIRMSRDMVKEIVMANSIYPICREDPPGQGHIAVLQPCGGASEPSLKLSRKSQRTRQDNRDRKLRD